MAGLDKKYTPKDRIKDAIFFVLTVAGSYGYILMMLMIFSFMTVAVIPLDFDHMLILSGVGTVIVAICYMVKLIKKYRH